MFPKAVVLWVALAGGMFAVTAGLAQGPAKLSAPEVVARNVAARGGLQAWRSVQSLTMSGKMDAGGNNRMTLPMPGRNDRNAMPPARPTEQIRLPFVMELKRPQKMRVEVQFNNQTAIQVFDGKIGWKLRPFLNRREVEPYTEEEMKSVATQAELDGPLVDYAAKGTGIELAGIEKVEGRDTYKLKLTLQNGKATTVWIDASTFLEAKIEGTPRRVDGKAANVEVYYRDYRSVDGLKLPFVIETKLVRSQSMPGAGAVNVSEQIVLDKVEVNPKLNDALFSKASLSATASGKPAIVAAAGAAMVR